MTFSPQAQERYTPICFSTALKFAFDNNLTSMNKVWSFCMTENERSEKEAEQFKKDEAKKVLALKVKQDLALFALEKVTAEEEAAEVEAAEGRAAEELPQLAETQTYDEYDIAQVKCLPLCPH